MKKQSQNQLPSKPVLETAPSGTVPDVAAIRAAASLDDAVKILQPTGTVVKPDAVYEVVTPCPAPLPQKRGTGVLVYAAACRSTAPFKIADIQSALGSKSAKNVAYWTRRLATLGFFRPTTA